MNLSDICAWLTSEQDFAQGCALYAQLGTSVVYQRLFALGETDYSRSVLLRELTSLVLQVATAVAPAAPEPIPVPPAPAPPAPAPEPPAPAPLADQPESPLLTGLSQQLRAVRDERSYLHPQLTAKNVGKKARLVVCLRIVALTAQEVELKAQQAHVRQHGRLPGPVTTAELSDQGELRRRLLNRRSTRSKLKKLPERAAELAAVETEITLILSKLTP